MFIPSIHSNARAFSDLLFWFIQKQNIRSARKMKLQKKWNTKPSIPHATTFFALPQNNKQKSEHINNNKNDNLETREEEKKCAQHLLSYTKYNLL